MLEVSDFCDRALEKGRIPGVVEPSAEVTPDDLTSADRIFSASGAVRVALRKT